MKELYTERFGMVAARVQEQLTTECANGLLSIIEARIAENWFGEAFLAECEDGGLNAGSDTSKVKGAVAGYKLIWPEDWRKAEQTPDDPLIFDLIEFSYEHVALPELYQFHSYWRRHHFNYDQENGLAQFTAEIKSRVRTARDDVRAGARRSHAHAADRVAGSVGGNRLQNR